MHIYSKLEYWLYNFLLQGRSEGRFRWDSGWTDEILET